MEVVFKYNLVQRRVAFGADFATHQHFSHLMSPSVKPRPACGTHARCSVPFVPSMETRLEGRPSTTELTFWDWDHRLHRCLATAYCHNVMQYH